MKKPVILSPRRLEEQRQQAHLAVIEERRRLAIEEANHQHHVRAACLNRLTTTANVTIQDFLEPNKSNLGLIALKDLTQLPREVARAVKKIKITNRTLGSELHGTLETVQTVEVELAHHLEYDERIGKYLGLFSDKHLHLHQQMPVEGAPKRLAELSPEQISELRTRLEKEVEALSVTDSEEEDK